MAGKNGGKKAPQTKAAETQAPAAEQAKEKQVNLIVKTENIYDRSTTKEDGSKKDFKSCNIPVMRDGKTEFASLAVDSGRVTQATRAVRDDKNEIVRGDDGKVKTEPIEGYSNVWLRGESSKVQLNFKDDEGKYTVKKTFTAGEVRDMNTAAKNAFKSEQKDAAKSKEEAAALEAPEADDQIEV